VDPGATGEPRAAPAPAPSLGGGLVGVLLVDPAAAFALDLALAAHLLADELLHARLLADAVAQVVELRAPHVAAAGDLDVLHARAVQREDALDALAGHDAAHGEGLAHSASAQGDDRPGEDLDALLVAL